MIPSQKGAYRYTCPCGKEIIESCKRSYDTKIIIHKKKCKKIENEDMSVLNLNLGDKINTFFKKRHEIFKKPLEKIINNMLNKCKYINEESLERHNWGNNPVKLKHIPKNIDSDLFEEYLLNALDLEDNEKSIVELLWGDIQLGKRVHACIVMWISVYILNRPVLYIFRNLTIDQKQLQDDILGTEKYNFNIQFIKSVFQEFNKELQEYFNEPYEEYWKNYKLPELKDINSNDIISKLSNKESLNSNDIFCCLMNHTQLEKINTKFSEYIYHNDELVNITVLVDESDLMSPTSSNDRTNDNDKKDSTECEKSLSKMYKKVKYALQITGTPHSLLYNITTRLSDRSDIQNKISKVHKMKRSDDYYGLFNDRINFNTTQVETWWDYQDKENHKKTYNIVEDYNTNIKKIIEEILKRPTINSLLISEEKKRVNHFCLVNKIVKDFPNLFIIIYHGNCLKLYLSKNYEKEIKMESSASKILGSSKDTEQYEKLANDYCYFTINTKKNNIKSIYRLLRILFEKSDTQILCKTIITITGKYGERGYSFTSDDYDNYSLHLTDQYFVSHASLNCTDISQRLRLQGKYNDSELKNGSMKLTLWTTPILEDIIRNFYVKFIGKIEKNIMNCDSWEEIKELLESIIDNGDLKFGKYMKYIDVSKKRKNLKPTTHYDKKHNGYKLIHIDDMTDNEINEWCKSSKLADYKCINEIKEMDINEFINKYGKNKPLIPKKINKEDIVDINDKQSTLKYLKKLFPRCEDYSTYNPTTENMNRKYGINEAISENKEYDYGRCKPNRCLFIDYENENYYHLVGLTDEKKLPIQTTDYIKKNPYIVDGDKVKFSIIKEYKEEKRDDFIEDDNKFPEKFYWKTYDDWLYLYDKDKPDIISLYIVDPIPIPVKNVLQQNISIEESILKFAESCCQETDKKKLRFGLSDIFKIYKNWCIKNDKKCLKTQKKFKEEFEKLGYKKEGKGVDVNNKSGKRGYNIMVHIDF